MNLKCNVILVLLKIFYIKVVSVLPECGISIWFAYSNYVIKYFKNAKLTIGIKEKDKKIFFVLSSRHFYILMLICQRIPRQHF